MADQSPLFRKPWGWPELLVILVSLVLIDFLTPNRELLPVFGGYIDAVRDIIKDLLVR
jgi:hypothetical protein